MRYTVEWGPRSLDMLAAVWLASNDRAAVTAAGHWFDRELARDPLRLGESRESPLVFVAFYGPLGIVYEVVPDDYLVLVQAAFASG